MKKSLGRYTLLNAVTPFHQDLMKFCGDAAVTAGLPPPPLEGRNWTGFAKLKFSLFCSENLLKKNLGRYTLLNTVTPFHQDLMKFCGDAAMTALTAGLPPTPPPPKAEIGLDSQS